MKTITLINQNIRQQDGLYSLNDLHKASGGEDKHRPGYFLANEQTKALIGELETAGIPAVKAKEGRNGGTYACRELVIAYAAWISPAFHLKVLSVFLGSLQASGMQTLPPAKKIRAAETIFNVGLRIARKIKGIDHNAALISANQFAYNETGANLLEGIGHSALIAENQASLSYTPTELGARIGGISAIRINQWLEDAGLQSKSAGRWQPTAKGAAHACIVSTGKTHGSGAPVEQVRWFESALPFIQNTKEAA